MIFKSFQSGQTSHMQRGQETGYNCFRVYPNTLAAICQSLISGALPGETITPALSSLLHTEQNPSDCQTGIPRSPVPVTIQLCIFNWKTKMLQMGEFMRRSVIIRLTKSLVLYSNKCQSGIWTHFLQTP